MKEKIPPEYILVNVLGGLPTDEKEDRFSQKADILCDNPSFQEHIAQFRKKRGIDCNEFNDMVQRIEIEEGQFTGEPLNLPQDEISQLKDSKKKFGTRGERKARSEDRKIIDQALKKEFNPKDTMERCKQIRSKTEAFLQKTSKIEEWVNQRLTMPDIDKIRKEFNLGREWEYPLIQYILTDKISAPASPGKIFETEGKLFVKIYGHTSLEAFKEYLWPRIRDYQEHPPRRRKRSSPPCKVLLSYKDENNEPMLLIEISWNAECEDIRREWPKVRKLQKQLSGKKGFRYKKNLKRDMQWHKWFEEGKTDQKIHKEYCNKLSDEEAKGAPLDDAVKKARQRLKKRIGE